MNETQLVRKFRQERGLSQKELADAIGVSQQHVAKLESGVHPVCLEMATLISGALGYPLHEVFPILDSKSLGDGFASLENAAASPRGTHGRVPIS